MSSKHDLPQPIARRCLFGRIFPPKVYTLPSGEVSLQPRSKKPIWAALLLIAFVVSVRVTGFSVLVLGENGREFFVILARMVPPNWEYWSSITYPLLDTLKMSLFGSVLGAILAVPLAILAARNITTLRPVNLFFQLIMSIMRTLPSLVTALIATYLVGIGVLAGTIAIVIFSVSYVGKILYEKIETVDMGAYEAMISLGMTKLSAFRYAVLPEVLPTYLSTMLFNFEGNVRYAAILGYVGAGGLGLLINERIGWRDYPSVGMILLSLLGAVVIIETLTEHFRRRLL